MRGPALFLAVALTATAARADDRDPADASEMINALLGGLLGFQDMSEAELQKEVAEVGGISFRRPVPVDYMERKDLVRYLEEVLDSEYPPARASADERTLVAFDMLPAGTDIRSVRARLLEQNIVGFYDERPGRKRLYAVSRDRRLTPSNQLVLAHELRHALQDQYADVHGALPEAVGDFDDRRLAFMSLLEGDATLVMERFLARRLPGLEGQDRDLAGVSLPDAYLPGVPAVLRDQLVRPYIAGRDFARAVWQGGGWDAVRGAWGRPPESSEQVLHPEKFASREAPLEVAIGYAPAGGRLLNEGVLGEMLIQTLLGDGAEAAAAGWGGDRFRVWDVSGRTLLVWQSRWDTAADAREFLDAARGRFAQSHGPAAAQDDWAVYSKGSWSVALAARTAAGAVLVASDDAAAFRTAVHGLR